MGMSGLGPSWQTTPQTLPAPCNTASPHWPQSAEVEGIWTQKLEDREGAVRDTSFLEKDRVTVIMRM
jgi:hypothetical protein